MALRDGTGSVHLMDGRETVIPSAGVDVCEGFGGQYRVVTGGNDGRWAGLELLDVGEL